MDAMQRKEFRALLRLIRDQAEDIAGAYGSSLTYAGEEVAADLFVIRALLGLAEQIANPKPKPSKPKPKPAKKRRRKKAKKRAKPKPKPKPQSYAAKLAEAAGDKK